MDLTENVGGTDRRTRAALAVILTVAAIRAFRKGKRKRALLIGTGALIAGFTSSTKYCPANEALGIDTAGEGTDLDLDVEDEGEGSTDTETTAETDEDDDPVVVEIDDSDDVRGRLVCSFCGDPIVPGERRGPNAQGDIVHDTCE